MTRSPGPASRPSTATINRLLAGAPPSRALPASSGRTSSSLRPPRVSACRAAQSRPTTRPNSTAVSGSAPLGRGLGGLGGLVSPLGSRLVGLLFRLGGLRLRLGLFLHRRLGGRRVL